MASPSKWVPVSGSCTDSQFEYRPKPTTIDLVGGIFCHICQSTFANKKDFDSHYLTHGKTNTNIVYTCVVCHKEIVSYPSFRGHCYLNHVTKDKFKCEYCEKVFSKQCVYQKHINTVHSSIYKCTICNKEFQSKNELYLHRITHKTSNEGPPYDCHVCGEMLENIDECESHVEDHCSMFYSCPICYENISDIETGTDHLTKHFGNVLIKREDVSTVSEEIVISNESSIDLIGGIFCCYCSDVYKTRNDFDNHFLVEHSDKKIVYSCNICGKQYEKYLRLSSHCYDHTTKDKFECEECFRRFPRLSLLVLHMEAFHTDKKSLNTNFPFTCLQCYHGFKTDRRLKEHYRIKHNIYYSQCPEQGCGKTFDTPKDLVLHLKRHTSNENWCKQCGLRFSSLEACKKHIQYHKKKHYSCPICAKNYGEKYLVMKHATQHFCSVLHVCKSCGKIYNSRNRLVQHMKVHTDAKPYVCTYCNKGFFKSCNLKEHLNVHTGLRPYKCTACPKTFASYSNFRKHLKNIHNVHSTEIKIHSDMRIASMHENNNQKSASNVNKPFDFFVDGISSEQIRDNNNALISVEPAKPVAVKMSVDMHNAANSFEESNESSSNDLDPLIIELLEENMHGLDTQVKSIEELQKELWLQSPIQNELVGLVRESAAVVPPEYGPEFVGEGECGRAGDIRLDDGPLPHIDPRLTLLPPPHPAHPAQPPWHPTLAKLEYYDFDTKIPAMDTSIY